MEEWLDNGSERKNKLIKQYVFVCLCANVSTQISFWTPLPFTPSLLYPTLPSPPVLTNILFILNLYSDTFIYLLHGAHLRSSLSCSKCLINYTSYCIKIYFVSLFFSIIIQSRLFFGVLKLFEKYYTLYVVWMSECLCVSECVCVCLCVRMYVYIFMCTYISTKQFILLHLR